MLYVSALLEQQKQRTSKEENIYVYKVSMIWTIDMLCTDKIVPNSTAVRRCSIWKQKQSAHKRKKTKKKVRKALPDKMYNFFDYITVYQNK